MIFNPSPEVMASATSGGKIGDKTLTNKMVANLNKQAC